MNVVANKPEKEKTAPKPSELFMSCANLYLQGSFPGTHCKLLEQAINWLEFCSRVEKAKEDAQEASDKNQAMELAETPEAPEAEAGEQVAEEKTDGEN